MFLLAQSEKDRDALNAQGAAYRLRFDIQFKTVVELRKFIESHPKYSPLADGRRLFDWLHANNGGEINARTLHMGFIALHGLDEAVLIQLPCIDRQPEAQSIRAGEPVKFEVVASGTALRYQWYKDGEAIVWATTPSY